MKQEEVFQTSCAGTIRQVSRECDTNWLNPTSVSTVEQGGSPPVRRPTCPNIGIIQPSSEERRGGLGRTYSTEPLSLKSFMKDSKKNPHANRVYVSPPKHGLRRTDINISDLIPEPLSLQQKAVSEWESKPFSGLRRRSSVLSRARESFALGMRELQGPIIRSKEPTILEDCAMGATTTPITPKATSGLMRSDSIRRIQGAVKRISSSKTAPAQTSTIIPNAERKIDGPDTPVVKRSEPFMNIDIYGTAHHSNEHFQEVYERAKKSLRMKSSEDKRRESLKKKIVVIGITDQSPGRKTSLVFISSRTNRVQMEE